MHPFNVYYGPIPNPLTLHPGQLVLTASVYPDKRSGNTGGFNLSMTLEHAEGLGVNFDLRPVETYQTIELAKARTMHVAAECRVTDVFLEMP